MALSGRKQADLLGSIAEGSAEGFNNKCEPCLYVHQHNEAHGFCVQCQEYLCKTCYDCHRKTKISRSHQILQMDELDKEGTKGQSYNECTEQCPIHQTEIIAFYCPTHNKLGCTDCMTIGHRACKIEYIPEKCADLASSKEYHDTMMELGKKLKETQEVLKIAENSRSDINNISKLLMKKIADFRKDINDRLDRMQQDILYNVERKKSSNVKIVKKVIDTCENIISDVKKLQSSLRANTSNNQNGQLYIDIKRAESALKSGELTEAKEDILNMNIHYSFNPNANLKKLFSTKNAFGEIISHPRPESTKKNTMHQLILKEDINLRTKSDKFECFITGCAVLPTSKLVLAEYNNEKIKIVSAENKRVLQEKIIDSNPLDIVVISQDQFAVTVPCRRRIDVIKVDESLSCVRSINVKGKCYGIDFHQDRIYVVCVDPSSVVVLTTQGNVLDNIPLNFLPIVNFTYIVVRKDSNLLYISDYNNNSVVSVSLQGDMLSTYKHKDVQGPMGMSLLDDGSLLVCSSNNGTIHQIKNDLKEGKKMYKDLFCSWSICYSAQKDEVFCCFGDLLKVLSTK